MNRLWIGMFAFSFLIGKASVNTESVQNHQTVSEKPATSAVVIAPKNCKADKDSVYKEASKVSKDILSKLSKSSKGARKETLVREVSPYFDAKLAAKKVLKQSDYDKLVKSGHLDTFENLLMERIIDQYSDAVGKISKTTKVNLSKRQFYVIRKNEVAIGGKIKVKGSQLRLKYRLSCDTSLGKWKIYDIEIEGIGVLKNYKKQIGSAIKKHGMEKLLKVMAQD